MRVLVLVLGASGATGRLVVAQLLGRGIRVRIVVREGARMPEAIADDGLVETVTGSISEFDPGRHDALVDGCDAVVSCLGHNLTLKGLFGPPHMLVYRSLEGVCEAVMRSPGRGVNLVLMNTTGNSIREMGEGGSLAERMILSLLTALLPPQRDNVRAASYLATVTGKGGGRIGWVAVRPDTLVDEDEPSPYEVYDTIQRSPLFHPGKTSRINVAHFMAELIADEGLWTRWKAKMPVIYNKEA